MISEHEKFNILAAVIIESGIPLIIRIRKPEKNKNRKPIDGWTTMLTQTITMTLPKPIDHLSSNEASEAASILLHENGHATYIEESERKAWKNAEMFLRRFPLLKPKLFDKIKQSDLAIYKEIQKSGIPISGFAFTY